MPSYLLKKSTGALELISGPLPLTTTPQAGPGTYEIFALGDLPATVTVGHEAPTLAGGLPHVTYTAGSGPVQIATDSAFAGFDLSYALTPPVAGATIDGASGVITLDTHTPAVRNLTITASNPGGEISTGFTATIEAASGTAPSFINPPQILPVSGPVGTVFAFDEGMAAGNPAPSLSLRLVLGGVDVTHQIAPNMTYTSTGPGALELQVTATNGVDPDAVATSDATVTSASGEMAPQLAAKPKFLSDAVPVGTPILLDPGEWYGGTGVAVTPTVTLAGVDVTADLVPQPDGRLQLTPTEAGALIARIEASNSQGSYTLYWHAQVLAADTQATFGQFDGVGQAALETSALEGGAVPDGTYGQFTVSGGVMTPNTSPLTPGEVTLDGRTFTVVRNAVTCASLAEIKAAYGRPSATSPAAGGKAGLQIRIRKGTAPWASPGNDYNNQFEGHSGLPCQITSADYADQAVLEVFGVGAPNADPTDPTIWGHVGCHGLHFFRHTRTRVEGHGANFINQYDVYNGETNAARWNFSAPNIVNIGSRGNWVEHASFFYCRFFSDLNDLSQIPIPDLPDEETSGIKITNGRFCVVHGCVAETLFNGYGISGEDNIFSQNDQVHCHGDMLRPTAVLKPTGTIENGGWRTARRLLVEGNRWYGSTGDNFRHPDGMHMFSIGAPGVDQMVLRGNQFICDAQSLRQPPKATGQIGTLLWQPPQTGNVTLPAQNAAAWLIEDGGAAASVTLPAIGDLPESPFIDGFYGAGATNVRITQTDAAWQVGDTFVHDGTTHTVTGITLDGVGRVANIAFTPGLSTNPLGRGLITSNSRMSQGASLAAPGTAGDTALSIEVPYGQLRPGDSFGLGIVQYRVDAVSGAGSTKTVSITPELKTNWPAGETLVFRQFWSVQRMGPQGAGITLNAAPGESFYVVDPGEPSQVVSSRPLGGAWAEYFIRPDFVARDWLLNLSANTAYQSIFSGTDPTDGYSDILFAFNTCVSPGKGIEVGFQTRPSQRNQAVSNICVYPWPGDLDGDGVANTAADGKQRVAPACKVQLGGLDENIGAFRLAGNVGGTAQLLTPTTSYDMTPLNHTHGDSTAKLSDFSEMSAIFQGAQGTPELFLPSVTSAVADLRPQPGGPTDGAGVGFLGTATDGSEDLWDMAECRLTRTTPWQVTKLGAVEDLDRLDLTWFEPAYRHRVSLFGEDLPVLGYGCEYSTDGGSVWTPVPALSTTQDVAGRAEASGTAAITGLAPGQTVEIRVRARNANGWGQWSQIQRTLGDTGQPVLAQSASLVLTPRAVPDRALVIAISYDSAGAGSRVDQLVINGTPFGTNIARAVAARGVAIAVLREADLGGFSGDLTIVPQWTGQPASNYDVGAITLSGIVQTGTLPTTFSDDLFDQSISLDGGGVGEMFSIGVSNGTQIVAPPEAELWRTDALGGRSVMLRQTGSGSLSVSTQTTSTWGILAGVRLTRL